ncbi:MAG: hypothetical protein IT440_06085 [Phycisphaeraceae bacterium]|nr:hypothetical protein [Phycisphaeraceae bacterium]
MPSRTPPSPSVSVQPDSEQVVDLLSKLGSDLRQLQDWQSRSQKQLAQWARRAKQLDEAEAELRRRGEEMGRLNEQLAARKQELQDLERRLLEQQRSQDHRREQLDEQGRQIEQSRRGVADRQSDLDKLEQTLLAAVGEVEQRREANQLERVAIDAAAHDLAKRQAMWTDQCRQEDEVFEEHAKALSTRERQLTEKEGDAANRELAFTQQMEKLARREEAVQRLQARLTEQEAQLQRQWTDLEKKGREHADAAVQISLRQENLTCDLQRQQQDSARLKDSLDAQAASLEHRRQELEQARKACDQRQAALLAKERKLRKLLHLGRNQLVKQHDRLKSKRQAMAQRLRQLRAEKQAQPSLRPDRPQSPLEDQVRELGQQRRMLVDVRRALEASEKRMIERWAAHRAGSLVFAAVLCLAVLAGVSHLAAQRLHQPQWKARLIVKLPDSVVASEAATSDDVRKRLLEPAVIREAHSLLTFRGYDTELTESQLQSQLTQSLTIAAAEHGRFRFSWISAKPALATAVLDALGKAYLTALESRYAGKVGHGELELVEAASCDAQPVADDYRILAAKIFGISASIALVAGLAVFLLLRRCQRVLDAQANPWLAQIGDEPRTPSVCGQDTTSRGAMCV